MATNRTRSLAAAAALFLAALFDKVGSVRNPLTLWRVLGAMGDSLRIDDAAILQDQLPTVEVAAAALRRLERRRLIFGRKNT